MENDVSMEELKNALRGINDLADENGIDIEKTILGRIMQAKRVKKATEDFKKRLEEGYYKDERLQQWQDWKEKVGKALKESSVDLKKTLTEGGIPLPETWLFPAADMKEDAAPEIEAVIGAPEQTKKITWKRSDGSDITFYNQQVIKRAMENMIRFKIEASGHIPIGELSSYRRGVNDSIRLLQQVLEG